MAARGQSASLVIFLLSAVLHELIVSIPFRNFKLLAFGGMMAQAPHPPPPSPACRHPCHGGPAAPALLSVLHSRARADKAFWSGIQQCAQQVAAPAVRAGAARVVLQQQEGTRSNSNRGRNEQARCGAPCRVRHVSRRGAATEQAHVWLLLLLLL
jgi:hypothetical protein